MYTSERMYEFSDNINVNYVFNICKCSFEHINKSHINYFQLGAARRIPGMTPAALMTLLHYVKRQKSSCNLA